MPWRSSLEGTIERIVRRQLGDLFAPGLGGTDQVGRLEQCADLGHVRVGGPRRADGQCEPFDDVAAAGVTRS